MIKVRYLNEPLYEAPWHHWFTGIQGPSRSQLEIDFDSRRVKCNEPLDIVIPRFSLMAEVLTVIPKVHIDGNSWRCILDSSRALSIAKEIA